MLPRLNEAVIEAGIGHLITQGREAHGKDKRNKNTFKSQSRSNKNIRCERRGRQDTERE
jgi:hypothetical protein